MWRIKVKHPSGATRLYSQYGPDTSIGELKNAIYKDFNLNGPIHEIGLTINHPPTKLPSDGTLASGGLADAQLISIVLPPPNPSLSKKAPSSKSTVSGQKKKGPKKARADESEDSDDEDHDVVLEDDSDEDEGRASRTRRPATKRGPRAAATANHPRPLQPFSGQVAGLHQPRRKIRSTEELAETLARSAAKGEKRDSVTNFFRKLTRNQVIKQWEIRAANDRYTAALSNKFEITSSTDVSYRLGDGQAMEMKLHVRYKKGPRSFREETVQALSEELLRETVRAVLHGQADVDDMLDHPREGLRAATLPLISPRVFWSLVKLYGGGVDCIEKALQKLLPGEDWSFLNTRVRRESERAKSWKQTEVLLEALEKGIDADQFQEDDANDEEEDALAEIVETEENRQVLREKNINTLLQLADQTPSDIFNEDWIMQAREIVLDEITSDILKDTDESVREKLKSLDVRTPADIARLRIPGRTEFVQAEAQVDKSIIDAWRTRAEEHLHAHPWLDKLRTRG